MAVRLYASKQPSSPSPEAEAAARKVHREKVKSAAERAAVAKPVVPEKVIIYHAGTGRTSFLAMLKVSSLLLGVFFCGVGVPTYVKAGEPELTTLGVALAGLVPATLITYISAPFVTHVHLHLPLAARSSRAALERYVAKLPSDAPLTVTTISPIGKPRYSSMHVRNLRPRRQRLGLVNYVRDNVQQENETRKWYMFRALRKFFVQPQHKIEGVKGKRKDLVERWIWEAVQEKIAAGETGKSIAAQKKSARQ